MKRKFDKCWKNVDNISCLLFVAVVLDPRYKLDYVKYCLTMVYDSHIASKLAKKLDSTLQRLLDFYGQEASKQDGGVNKKTRVADITLDENDLLRHYLKHRGDHVEKNDLERYLADKNVNPKVENFNILAW